MGDTVTPEAVLAVSAADLRACGLSERKVRSSPTGMLLVLSSVVVCIARQ